MTSEREVVIDSKYRARKQFRRFHRRTQRWAILVCHRRAGKTVASVTLPMQVTEGRMHIFGIAPAP